VIEHGGSRTGVKVERRDRAWRQRRACVRTRHIAPGQACQLRDAVRLRDFVRRRDAVRFRDAVLLRDFVRLRDAVRFRDAVRLGDAVRLRDFVRLRDVAPRVALARPPARLDVLLDFLRPLPPFLPPPSCLLTVA